MIRTLPVVTLVAVTTVTGLIEVDVRARPQQGSADAPAFEVASVKPNNSGEARVSFTYRRAGGRFNATNATLRLLICNVYQLQDSQIVGGPSWLNADRFDIVAKADLESSQAFPVQRRDGPSRLQLMMRALLAERFKLAVHHETKPVSAFTLVVARRDGRLGPALRPSAGDCDALAATARARNAAPPSNQPAPVAPTRCGAAMGIGHFTVGGGTLFQLANTLSNIVGQAVVDRTGLTGNFDIDLTWTPEQTAQRPPDTQDPPHADPDGPSIFTALQEQLGLKLESEKTPVDVLVIDHAEHPIEN
jgi:uncharacterized protein (TIGR03435 family)